MGDSHRIRLAEPWDRGALPDGRAVVRRNFGRPRYATGETVWIEATGWPAGSHVRVNAVSLGTAGATGHFAIDVTVSLAPRNQLVVELPAGTEVPAGAALAVVVRGSDAAAASR